MILEIKYLLPGEHQPLSENYKGKNRYRSVVFLNDYKTAQFFEVDNKLHTDWKKLSMITHETPDVFCAMNLSLEDMFYVEVFHNDENITLEKITSKVKNVFE